MSDQKVKNPVNVSGTTNGKIVAVKVCGHNLSCGCEVKDGKFSGIMPSFPTGRFQLELWVDGAYHDATWIEVTA